MQTAVRTGKIQGRQTAQLKNAVCGGGRRTKEIFFQPANMQHAVHGHTGDWAQGLLHAKRMYTSQQWPHGSYTEKIGAGWFRAFFEQEHLSRIGVEKPPKSSRPAFSRVYCPPGPCANSGTDRQDTRPTNSTAETLSVEGAGGRKKSFSSQRTCSMLCMDTLGIEPRACQPLHHSHVSFS